MSVDSLTIFNRLKSAGEDERIASEHAEILRELSETQLTPKQDLQEAKQDIKLIIYQAVLIGIGINIAATGLLLTVLRFWGP